VTREHRCFLRPDTVVLLRPQHSTPLASRALLLPSPDTGLARGVVAGGGGLPPGATPAALPGLHRSVTNGRGLDRCGSTPTVHLPEAARAAAQGCSSAHTHRTRGVATTTNTTHHEGAALYTRSAIRAANGMLESRTLTNPHSRNPSSVASEEAMAAARKQVRVLSAACSPGVATSRRRTDSCSRLESECEQLLASW
jgi:hypothetical protein